MMDSKQKITQLLKKGVTIFNPESIEIGPEVDIDNIAADGVVIHSGCRIHGASTVILQKARLGYETPVTIQDCQIGPDVDLKGGFFKETVFLEKAAAGSGSHVREGCIFEEQANIAHTVGLKQTILFPFVTLGSLINFCDCLMAGGTSRKDHSEVGSSYIHFNFTPNQDKATPSLIGDVPNGVMLNQNPIFLGGQGGLVGPIRLAFGTVIAAGTLIRKDELRPGRLIFSGTGKGGNLPFHPGIYRGLNRILTNNINYIGNIISLRQWYINVRTQFYSKVFPKIFQTSILRNIDLIIDERVHRLEQLAEKMPQSIQAYIDLYDKDTNAKIMVQQRELHEHYRAILDRLDTLRNHQGDVDLRDQFLDRLGNTSKVNRGSYIDTIKSVDNEAKQMGSQWLQGIVDETLTEVLKLLPSFS